MNKKTQQPRGFTLIEVIVSLIVFMTAVVGLVALQSASIAGAEQGRVHTAATNIARFFLAELKTEVSSWRPWMPGDAPDDCSGTDFTDLPLLSQAFDDSCGWGVWREIDSDIDTLRIDPFMGHSALAVTQPASPEAIFCVNYRIDPIPALEGGENILEKVLWQVSVRVAWPRAGQYGTTGGTSLWTNCSPAVFAAGGARQNVSNYVELVEIASREFAQ